MVFVCIFYHSMGVRQVKNAILPVCGVACIHLISNCRHAFVFYFGKVIICSV